MTTRPDQAALEALCDRWLDAWTGNTPEGLAAFYTEGCFYADPARPNGLQGRDALLGYLRRLLGRNPAWRWTRVRLWPTDEGFTLRWRASVPRPDADPITFEGMDEVVLDGDRIAVNRVYFDPRPLA